MASESFPVFVLQPNGERARVGAATRQSDGSFLLQLGDLVIGERAEAAPAIARRAAPPIDAGGLPTQLPNYGRSKAAPIQGASQQDLEYYAAGARRSLEDPSKQRFHDKERALLQAIDQEMARQGLGGGDGRDSNEPPPPGDEDNIPF